LPNGAARRNMPAMTPSEKSIADRIKELEGSAQKARLEAMQVAAMLLTKETARMGGARPNADSSGDIAALKARYDMLKRVADDAQSQLDKLHADHHDVKYYR
jgi:hypothetical protein